MGTIFSAELWCASSSQCDAAFAALDDILARIDARMSIYHDSELTRVNDHAGAPDYLQAVSSDVLRVLAGALDIAGKSRGLFDPTILPLLKSYGLLTENFAGETPAAGVQRLAMARSLVDYRKVRVVGNRAGLTTRGMGLDFGGIAKGFALDEVSADLRAREIEHFVLNFGGHLLVSGVTHRTTVAHPRDAQTTWASCLLSSGSLSVSAQDKRYVITNGKRRGHLIHPRSAEPFDDNLLAMVHHTSAMQADAWSTALFLASPAEFRNLTTRHKLAAMLLTNTGDIVVSESFAARRLCTFSTSR